MLLSELISDSESSWWNKLGNHLAYLFFGTNFWYLYAFSQICMILNAHSTYMLFSTINYISIPFPCSVQFTLQYFSWNSAHSTTAFFNFIVNLYPHKFHTSEAFLFLDLQKSLIFCSQVQGVPSICPQLWFQFMTFVIALSKETINTKKPKWFNLNGATLIFTKLQKLRFFFHMLKKNILMSSSRGGAQWSSLVLYPNF